MKKITKLLATIPFLFGGLFIFGFAKNEQQIHYIANNKNTSLNQNKQIENRNFNPAYPAINNNINISKEASYYRGSAGDGDQNYYSSTFSFNWHNYANNWNDFLKYYPKIYINFWYSSELKDSNGTGGFDKRTEEKWVLIDTTKFNDNWADTKKVGGSYQKWTTNWGQNNIYLQYIKNGDILNIRTKVYSKVHIIWSGAGSVTAYVNTQLKKIEIPSTFSVPNLKTKIKQSLEKKFTFNSDTSPVINSDDTISVAGKVDSNKTIIENEINSRIKKGLGQDYEQWMKFLEINVFYKLGNNTSAFILIKDSKQISGNEQFITQVGMPVKINLTDNYWQKETKKRLTISAGKIVLLINSTYELVEDNPEFINENGKEVYVYHNNVDVNFKAKSGSKELLFVDGKEVEVLNDLFSVTLTDGRDFKNNDEEEYTYGVEQKKNNYLVEVKDGNEIKMSLNIRINLLDSQVDFKWLAWKPLNDPNHPNEYRQWLLTQKMVDGKVNDKYDPTINPKTGGRNQIIFVGGKQKDPFAVDPLDKWGNVIKPNDPDKDKKYNYGYIAEGIVFNMGVKTLFNDLKNVAKVERVEVDSDTFEEIGERKVVDLTEVQFSTEGLWHYIITLNDYVATKVNPINPNVNEVKASAGSTIHKLIYISNKNEEYANFLDLDFIKDKNNISDFFLTIQGTHLLFFLANQSVIATTEDLLNMSYEEIVKYWKYYVSAMAQQLTQPPDKPADYVDLEGKSFSTIKMNTTLEEVVKNNVQNEVIRQMRKYSEKTKYGDDFEIYYNGRALNSIDFSDFVKLSENGEWKTMQLDIKAKTGSIFLTGSSKIKIMNSNKFDPKKALDLTKLKFTNYEYNFTSASDEVKKGFVDNYLINNVINVLNKNKPIGLGQDYLYGIDFKIYLNGNEYYIKTQTALEEVLDKFLNSKEKVVLNVSVKSVDESYLLTGENSYTITNDPDSENVAPEKPGEPNNKDKSLTKKDSKILAIILGSLAGALVLGLVIWFVIKTRYMRPVATYNTKEGKREGIFNSKAFKNSKKELEKEKEDHGIKR